MERDKEARKKQTAVGGVTKLDFPSDQPTSLSQSEWQGPTTWLTNQSKLLTIASSFLPLGRPPFRSSAGPIVPPLFSSNRAKCRMSSLI